MKLIAATWREASKFMEEGRELLLAGNSPEDAIEHVICRVEDDPEERSVGYNGFLTKEGKDELDASFMEGRGMRIGAVAGLSGFRNPIKAARLVMERTPHNLIVGAGANAFAAEMGLERRNNATEGALSEIRARREQGIRKPGHDTVGVIALADGHFACGLSTCGFMYRMPGRVSDSALPACGYFCDDSVGAVVCTGAGEDIMRGSLASRTFFYLEQGLAAPEAALRAVREVHSHVKGLHRIAALAVDREGRIGGAANHSEFCVSHADAQHRTAVDDITYCFAGTDKGIPEADELYL